MTVSKDQFIERARVVHGDAYDYSRVVMRGMRNKVEIVCPKHGPFWQRPGDHVRGQGCRECAKAKRAATNLERYGATTVMNSEHGRKKARETSLRNWDTEHPMQSTVVKERYKAAIRREYGVDWALAAPEVRAKRETTMVERHGDAVPMRCDDSRAKAQETARERYGADWAIASDVVQEHIKETCQERFGVDWPMQSSEVRERMAAGLVAKLGVEHALESDEVKARMVERSREQWGTDWPCQTEAVKAAIQQSCLKKFGVPSPMQAPEVIARGFATKKANGTMSSSSCEDDLYELLCEQFGKDDVDRQHRDAERYPFACDFYVRSLDLFIELNASWTHGGHWFDPNSPNDIVKLEEWADKAKRGHEFYDSAMETWVIRDPRKRDWARSKGINYLVFWDNDLTDAKAWLASLRRDEEMI